MTDILTAGRLELGIARGTYSYEYALWIDSGVRHERKGVVRALRQ